MKLEKILRAQTAIVTTFAIATLLVVATLCADVGVMYQNYLRLQKGTQGAAAAGARYLSRNVTLAATSVNANCAHEPDNAQKAACTYAIDHALATDSRFLEMSENTGVRATPDLQVTIYRKNIPYIFGKVIGLPNYDLAAQATAE